jgi:O-antigen/teichoic acid export membrane protein
MTRCEQDARAQVGRLIRRGTRYVRSSSGARAAGLLLIGTAAVNLGSWAYNLLCIRWLGSREFGDVAALTAVSTIAFLPLLGVQSTLAREVAKHHAVGDARSIAGTLRYATRRLVIAAAAAFIGLVCLAPLAEGALNLKSASSAIVTAALIAIGITWIVLQGALQGLQRFGQLATVAIVYGLARPILVVPLVLAGFGAAGAMGASVIATILALALVAIPLWSFASREPAAGPLAEPSFDAFSNVVIGLIAFTLLTNLDLIVAKIFLSAQAAGTYSSAALIGKLAAQVPAATVGTILLPKAIAHLRRKESIGPLVSRALIVTVVFGAVLTSLLALVPQSLVTESFGSGFAGARDLLAPCAAAMTLCGVLNVHLMLAVAVNDRAFIRTLCVAALGQIALFALLHGSAREIIAATAIAPGLALLLHELRSPHAARHLLRMKRVPTRTNRAVIDSSLNDQA